MEATTNYNRAARRRKAMREARELLERVARARRPDHTCPLCGALFDCDPDCVIADTRTWLATHKLGADS